MDVQITTRHIEVSSALRKSVTDKINRLQRFYEKCTSCHVVLGSEHADKTAEIVMTVRGKTLTAKARSEHVRKSADAAIDKLERQLRRLNERVKEHKASKAEIRPDEVVADEDEET
jgi:putative sigma-54 modulation protein